MDAYVPVIVDERPIQCAAGAPTRIPSPIVSLTILALVDVLVLFGTSVAVMELVAEAGRGLESQYPYDYDVAIDAFVSSFEGHAAPSAVVAAMGMLACLLTLCAEMTTNVGAKTKLRNVVGVCWAITIGFAVAACVTWAILYFKESHATSADSPTASTGSPTAFSILVCAVMICDSGLLLCSISLTVACYWTRYSACGCCTTTVSYQLFHTRETGAAQPAVAWAQQPMLAFPQEPTQMLPTAW